MAQTGQCCGQMELCLFLVEVATWGMGAAGALMDVIECDTVEKDSQGQCPDTGWQQSICVHVCIPGLCWA